VLYSRLGRTPSIRRDHIGQSSVGKKKEHVVRSVMMSAAFFALIIFITCRRARTRARDRPDRKQVTQVVGLP
jgi:hypothetical protein